MSSSVVPPERISIKRRRQDEPVDTLVLEEQDYTSGRGNDISYNYRSGSHDGGGGSDARDKKRRFTDFIFQRLKKSDQNIPGVGAAALASAAAKNSTGIVVNNDKNNNDNHGDGKSSNLERYRFSGLPIVRATNPGDEDRDFAKLKSSVARANEGNKPIATNSNVIGGDVGSGGDKLIQHDRVMSATTKQPSRVLTKEDRQQQEHAVSAEAIHAGLESTSDTASLLDKIKSARRFHLTRDLSATPMSPLGPNSAGGIRRRKQNLHLRPPLATFIERRATHKIHHEDDHSVSRVSKGRTVDSIVHINSETDRDRVIANMNMNASEVQTRSQTGDDMTTISTLGSPSTGGIMKTPLKTFYQSTSASKRQGQSMYDDPSTWDLQSDQLANELAALALELDPDGANTESDIQPSINAETLQQESDKTSNEVMMLDPDMGGDDEGDYVFETYVRVQRVGNPEFASTLFAGDVGVLVIDEADNDLWEKYIHEDDEDDWDDEDEDSNAEENPRNDYPEDEVSSDDERGTNVYKYRHNRSEDEEYGDD